ncbi:MAG: CAP domain-containing protein [Microthrixaceae bacterium]
MARTVHERGAAVAQDPGAAGAGRGWRATTLRRRLVLGLVALLAIGLLGACESNRSEQNAVRDHVNASRAAAGLPALRENLALDVKADAWAQRMRNSCRIWHSRLADGAPPNWRKLGENVGMGGNVAQIHKAYMNSPGHRANVLDPAFDQIGTAAVWGRCNGYRTLFTVHVFMKS